MKSQGATEFKEYLLMCFTGSLQSELCFLTQMPCYCYVLNLQYIYQWRQAPNNIINVFFILQTCRFIAVHKYELFGTEHMVLLNVSAMSCDPSQKYFDTQADSHRYSEYLRRCVVSPLDKDQIQKARLWGIRVGGKWDKFTVITLQSLNQFA